MGRRKTAPTQLECPNCKNIQIIQRKRNRMKEKFHIKHFYCYKCKEVTGHVEVKEDVYLPDWLKDA